MKKLFLFAAIIMTGFAFYSCEDVVDNPAQDPAQSWKYSVSVKFADFDFNGAVDENSVPYTYKAPTTLYVLNEENTLMGTITTDAAPAAGDYGTYAGTLTGSIGNNLIITTKIGNDLGKQDGTLKSAIENGIVQIAEVPIKVYNANSGKLTTAAAKLENTSAIAHVHINQLIAGDKVTFSNETQSFEWTVNDKFEIDYTDGDTYSKSTSMYVAIPKNGNAEEKWTVSSNKQNGEVLAKEIASDIFPLIVGKVSNDLGSLSFDVLGVDLTIWDAYERKANNITGTTYYWKEIAESKPFIITQSGEKAVNTNVTLSGNYNADVAVTLNNIRLEKNNYFEISNGANFAITLIGENKFEMLNLNSPFTKKGDGTWKFDQLNIGGNAYMSGTDLVVNYAAEYTINEDMTLKHLSVSNGGKLTIAEGKKVTVINDEGIAVSVYRATFNIGKGATLQAESKAKDAAVINIESADFNVGENATVTAQGGKEGRGMRITHYSSDYQKANVNIGKNATVNLVGGPMDILGYGLYIENVNNATTNITLDEGATVNATGIDRYGIYCYAYQWNSYTNTVTFNIAKNAKITAEDVLSGGGLYAQVEQATLNFDGEGTLEAKSKDGTGMQLNLYYLGKLNFKGGNISAIAGGDKPAITCNNNLFTIAPEIKSFKAQKGATATQYISRWGSEVDIANLVADKDKFNDAIADGTRTITPKPAEK